MLRRIATLVGALVLALSSVLIVFLVGMRRKYPPVLDAVRKFNRAVSNPRQMETAGTVGAYASIIRHTGRKSGRPFETPIVVLANNGEFLIVLPYGLHADWVKNVMASGSATIVNEGNTYEVDRPEVITTEAVAAHFPPKELRTLRLFGIDQCLRLRRVESLEATERVTEQE